MNNINPNKLHRAEPTRARNLGEAASQTLAMVLAGGRGERLHGLTHHQAKPALHFGGKFRMIDFPLSNAVNSGIRRIAVATQYRAHELIHHVQRTWSFLRPELSEFVEVLPAQQQAGSSDWYAGTADAVYQNIEIIRRHAPRYVLILAGDHVYKQDYRPLIADHIQSGADVTISCVEVPREDGRRFGVMGVDANDIITEFYEKPESPPGLPEDPDRCLASTGIYLFNTDVLVAALREDASRRDSRHDFGGDIIPALLVRHRIAAHRFGNSCIGALDGGHHEPYWRDVGTIDAYWQANMDLVRAPDMLNLYDENWRILTHQENCAPARFMSHNGEHAEVTDSIVGNGSIVSAACISRSILAHRTIVGPGAHLVESLVLPNCEIGAGARLHRCILAEDCKVPADLVVGEDPEFDGQWFHRTSSGITLVTPAMLARYQAQRPVRASNNEVAPRVRYLHPISDVA